MSRYPSATAPVCPVGLPGCAGKIRERGAKSCANCSRRGRKTPEQLALSPEASVEADRSKLKATSELAALRKKYDVSLRTIEGLQRQLDIAGNLNSSIDTFTIEPRMGTGT